MRWDDDDPLKVRLGRFLESEGREMERLFDRRFVWPRGRGLGSSGGKPRDGKVVAWRSRTIADNWRWSASGRQVVVREVSNAKSRAQIVRTIRYIGRLGEIERERKQTDSLRMFDHHGRPIMGMDVLGMLSDWGLLSDAENLSRKARRQLAESGRKGLSEMKERDRLHHVQGRHMILSIPGNPGDESEVDRFRMAVDVTVGRLFGTKGYPALWAVHRDCPDRLHAHVVVGTVSGFGERLRIDQSAEFFDRARIEFASALNGAGFDFDASRREDRWDLRGQILAGEEPLRKHKPIRIHHCGRGELRFRAPVWWARFGGAYEGRSSGKKRWLVKAVPKRNPSVDSAHRKLADLFSRHFRQPEQAVEAWLWLVAEGTHRTAEGQVFYPNLPVAKWYLGNRPEAFGDLLSGARQGPKKQAIEDALVEAWLPVGAEPPSAPIQAGTSVLCEERKALSRMRVCVSLLDIAEATDVCLGNPTRGRGVRSRLLASLAKEDRLEGRAQNKTIPSVRTIWSLLERKMPTKLPAIPPEEVGLSAEKGPVQGHQPQRRARSYHHPKRGIEW